MEERAATLTPERERRAEPAVRIRECTARKDIDGVPDAFEYGDRTMRSRPGCTVAVREGEVIQASEYSQCVSARRRRDT